MSYTNITGIGGQGNQTGFKLVYFDARGRAETARLLFALAAHAYDDVRVSREEWGKVKEGTPFGQLPYLEVGGESVCQSHAIERLLAKKFGLYGYSDLDHMKVDMVMDCTEDVLQMLLPALMSPDPKKKEEAKSKFLENFSRFLAYFEKMVGPNHVFVGKEITLADIAFFSLMEWVALLKLDLDQEFSKVPKLKKLHENVTNHPRIKEWLNKRPKTMF